MTSLGVHHWLVLAGALHFAQIPAMMLAPRMLGWREDLLKMQAVNRQIFKVIAGAIMLAVCGLGLVVVLGAREIAAGGSVGIALSTFLASWWLYRALVQVFVYAKTWPRTPYGRVSHLGLCVLFLAKTTLYAAASAALLLASR